MVVPQNLGTPFPSFFLFGFNYEFIPQSTLAIVGTEDACTPAVANSLTLAQRITAAWLVQTRGVEQGLMCRYPGIHRCGNDILEGRSINKSTKQKKFFVNRCFVHTKIKFVALHQKQHKKRHIKRSQQSGQQTIHSKHIKDAENRI